jgi:LacI family transcriptional regulator
VPLVLIDRRFRGFDSDFVGINDYHVGEQATEHLIAQGCRRIAHIRGPANSVGKNRFFKPGKSLVFISQPGTD